MHLNFKQLEAFLAVAQTLNFSHAASQVHLSQPALSANIRRLEEMVGARLFNRDTRTVSLTAVGEEFLKIALDLRADVDHSLERIHDFVSGKQGRLVIAAAPSLAAGFLPEVLMRFKTAYPGIQLTLHDVLSDDCISMVRKGTADVALAAMQDEADDLLQQQLMPDHLVALCASGHPLAQQEEVTWSDVSAFDQIVLNGHGNLRQLMEAAYQRQGTRLNPVFEVERVHTMLGLIAAGLGVGTLPFSMIAALELKGLVCRRIRDAQTYRIMAVITPVARSTSPTTEPFVRLCLENAGSSPGSTA